MVREYLGFVGFTVRHNYFPTIAAQSNHSPYVRECAWRGSDKQTKQQAEFGTWTVVWTPAPEDTYVLTTEEVCLSL